MIGPKSVLKWVYDAANDAARELRAEKIETEVAVLGYEGDVELQQYCNEQFMVAKFPSFVSEDDLIQRYLKVAEDKYTHIIRLTADCWQMNPKLIKEIAHLLEKADYASNTIFRTFLEGLDVQGCSLKALKWFNKHQTSNREHPFIDFDANERVRVDFEKEFKYLQLINPRNPAVFHASIDTGEDLNRAREIYSASEKSRSDLDRTG